MIYGLHREVEGHELADGPETTKGSTNSNASKTDFCDWGVYHPLVTVLLP